MPFIVNTCKFNSCIIAELLTDYLRDIFVHNNLDKIIVKTENFENNFLNFSQSFEI
jgi:hypothetical protein